jgi:lipopolysaccharide export LptBFGC system permease protein LptF
MYCSNMAVIVAPIAMSNTSSSPAILPILFVIVLLAVGYLAGRGYVNRRMNRRNWK